MAQKVGVAYWLGNALYVALTNRPRGLALAASRGPSFSMPQSSDFAPLAAEPTVSDVVEAVLHAYSTDPRKGNKVLKRLDGGEVDPGIVFSGLGDPLLRLDTLLQAAATIRHEVPGVKIRLSTNGLVGPTSYIAASLRDANIDEVTVALNAADPATYASFMLMPPPYTPPYFATAPEAVGEVDGASFGDVCAFIAALAEGGTAVAATCVARPGVDVASVRALALALGARDFKERSWHP
jgi:pyruvate-formate lyase-activating enzyme